MGITFRESVAEVELGLVAPDQLPDVAASGLLEGYESAALASLAGRFGEPADPVEVERLWRRALEELEIPGDDRAGAARILVGAYARLVVEGEVPPQLGASKIAGVHRVVQRPGCDRQAPGDCIGAATVIRLFYAQDVRGFFTQPVNPFDGQIVDECRRLARVPAA
jgi:hypothetical protein